MKRQKRPPLSADPPPEPKEEITSPSNQGDSEDSSTRLEPPSRGGVKHRLQRWGSALSGVSRKRQNRGTKGQKKQTTSDSSESQPKVSTVSLSDCGKSVSSLTETSVGEGVVTRSKKGPGEESVIVTTTDSNGRVHSMKKLPTKGGEQLRYRCNWCWHFNPEGENIKSSFKTVQT